MQMYLPFILQIKADSVHNWMQGFSLVLVQHKERDFLVAFGGLKKDPSNQVNEKGNAFFAC